MISKLVYERTVDSYERIIKDLSRKMKKATEQQIKFKNKYHYCPHCKGYLEHKDLGVAKVEEGRMEMNCQPMGDYDQRQVIIRMEKLCCIHCGHLFDKTVKFSKEVWQETPWLGRWQDRHFDWLFDKPYTKRIGEPRKIRKDDKFE